jgi:hypothetical protein
MGRNCAIDLSCVPDVDVWSEVGGQLLNCVFAKIAKHKPCTICTRDGHGRRRTAGGPAELGRFFSTGVAEEHWDVYPHLDEITVSYYYK